MTVTSMARELLQHNPEFDNRVEAVRRFNRLYTTKIGLLQKSHLDSGYSLTEARILFELSQRSAALAREIGNALGLDQGYLSRILARFEKGGLIRRQVSAEDGRAQTIALTKAGQKVYAGLDAKAHDAIAALLESKTEDEQKAIATAAATFEHVLGGASKSSPVVIRMPRPGDLGWVIHRHGAAICSEFGWNLRFESKIAEILGGFGAHPGREQGWIVERDGDILGSVFVLPEDDAIARLRVLYVEKTARGMGLGSRLVGLSIGFAKQAGYKKLVLWTHDFQKSARRIYQAAGFRLVKSEKANNFGVDVVSETWELVL